MSPLPLTPELARVARRVVWFRKPEESVGAPYHFIAHVLTYGTFDDVRVLKKHLKDSDLQEAMDHAPPGIFDPRSWSYWNLMMGRFPAPPMPCRKL